MEDYNGTSKRQNNRQETTSTKGGKQRNQKAGERLQGQGDEVRSRAVTTGVCQYPLILRQCSGRSMSLAAASCRITRV